MTKEDLIKIFKGFCKDPEFISERLFAMKHQVQKDIWRFLSRTYSITIMKGSKAGVIEYYNASTSGKQQFRFNITKREYKKLKKLYLTF